MDFEPQPKALVWFHLQEPDSGRRLLQDLEVDEFARTCIAPTEVIKTRSLEQYDMSDPALSFFLAQNYFAQPHAQT